MNVRRFTLDDQLAYAAASGDYNPIHVDPVHARRLVFGVVVHGVHAALWALDAFCAATGAVPARVRASFLRPIALDEEVAVDWLAEAEGWRINLLQNEAVTASLGIACRTGGMLGGERTVDELPPRREPMRPAFEAIATLSGVAIAAGDDDRLRAMFPALCAHIGTLRVAAFNALSRVVGMECPGMNSLFVGFDVEIVEGPVAGHGIAWSVESARSRAAPVRMRVQGAGLRGDLTFMVRPEPVVQPPFADIARHVTPGEFRDVRGLVVGGSRGLGEVAAKILAAGGADVRITHRSGQAEASAVCADITAGGGRCSSTALDVLAPGAPDLHGWQPDAVLYFATPPIKANPGATFDARQYEGYLQFYVQGLLKVLGAVDLARVRVFHPSTVYVTQAQKGFSEYAAAKSAAEALCEAINRVHAREVVQTVRLPRMLTDQTNAIGAARAASPLDVLLPALRQLLSP